MGQPILAAAGFQPALALGALLCISAALFAQPNDQPAAEWIRSPEPLKQAWGAHVIAEQKLTAFIPELLRVVESPGTSTDADAAKFAALDTLIQLNADVPLSDLDPLTDRFPTDVLILASRSYEDATDLLLKLLDRPHNREAFVAVGDLLTPKRNAGFAKAALKEFCQSAYVRVFNPEQADLEELGTARDSVAETDPPRVDWPDVGSYRLYPGTGDRRQAWSLLAEGPHPVSFVRAVSKSYGDHGFDFSGEESNNNSCLRAEDFLAQYLETPTSQLPVHSAPRLNLVWTTPEAFETAVRAFIARQQASYGLVAAQLVARGYLTADEASKAKLKLNIGAADLRQHDHTQLPFINNWAKEPK